MLDKKNHKVRLLFWVCISAVLSFSGFAFWPVFLIELGPLWTLTNTQIGWISGGYFIGYVVATPILVGLTDRIDSKLIFIFGCLVGIAGNLSFILFAESFLTAFLAWSFIGCGLAGTYMPGLQILNARLKKKERINAVPWYTATFSIGTAISFLLMGFMLINFNYLVAINLNIFFLVTGGLLIYIFVLPQKVELPKEKSLRNPFDFRLVVKKRLSIKYILSYGAHTFELMAFRSWIFALFYFLAANNSENVSERFITILVSLISLSGILASIAGAKIAMLINRQKVLEVIGLSTFLISLLTALSLKGPLILAITLLWLYSLAIMLDSGALTAGAVESSDHDNRGAVLAVHSMIGFLGGAIGGPIIGLSLDVFGGKNSESAWFYAVLCMGLGSLLVYLIQRLIQVHPKDNAPI